MGVHRVLERGDFHLQSYASNSPAPLASVDPRSVNPASTLPIGVSDETTTVLGVVWRPRADMLAFNVGELENITFTRVGLLSRVASIFDPLGSAAPLVVKGKIRLRELAVRGLRWNDPVPPDLKDWWLQWFAILGQLRYIEFPRCLFLDEGFIVRMELHTFCDASEEAYAAVVNIRNVYDDGRVLVRQVKGGTKLSPTKTLSVPKLELNAALLGARLARTIQNTLTRQVTERFFWTDNSTVRNWVRATAAFYQTFVSHRLGEIQTLTDAGEWRFVLGKINPADAATRS